MPMFKCACVVLLLMLASGCSGSNPSPSAPSTPSAAPVSPASPSAAVLAVARFTVVAINNSGTGTHFNCAVPSLVLTETGGTSGALVTGLQFHLNTANPADGYLGSGFPVHKRVDAGATSEIVDPPVYGDFQYDFGGSHDFTSVSVVVSYVDDAGRSGSLTAVAPVSQP